MATLKSYWANFCPAYANGAALDGVADPGEANNDPATGKSRGLVVYAKKETWITHISVVNRHTADARLLISQTKLGVYYVAGAAGSFRRSPDSGWLIPAKTSYDLLVGKRWYVGADVGLSCLTNVSIFGITALVLDISGETN